MHSPPPPGTELDDLGLPVPLARPVRRVVSLVPSLTEAVAVSAPGLIVGATAWCTHPAELETERIGGTKNPDTPRIAAMRPDLVIANEEENRAPDLDALRAAGIPVWVTRVQTLDQAFASLDRLLTLACGLDRPAWLDEAVAAWSPGPGAVSSPVAGAALPPRTAIVPIWRRPWMVLGRDTFAGDLLARLGVANLYAHHAERYPAVPLETLRAAGADLVVLPDEPYAFAAHDGPEAFPGLPAALVSGRHLTWYGPSLVRAREVLAGQLTGAGWRGATRSAQ
ncbi:ABC transporter substrate-binding protein [Actinospica durhamensis]|uniref:ABC transporter substrate-binding protein n=2 Tax=Actinospica durhamensis TaxID=1508375 RepID=A0A941ISD2_9ACTN|nr:ABC transporter substrate-binding protein [Actinospica durhamensis]